MQDFFSVCFSVIFLLHVWFGLEFLFYIGALQYFTIMGTFCNFLVMPCLGQFRQMSLRIPILATPSNGGNRHTGQSRGGKNIYH